MGRTVTSHHSKTNLLIIAQSSYYHLVSKRPLLAWITFATVPWRSLTQRYRRLSVFRFGSVAAETSL